jgi:hypothetical protein
MKVGLSMIRRTRQARFALAALAGITLIQYVTSAKTEPAEPAPPPPPYARAADLVGSAPAIAVVRVTRLTAIAPEQMPGVPAGKRRILVSGETMSLIRGNDVLARQMAFIMDIADSGERKLPKWKGRTLLIFGKVEPRVDFFQLLSSAAVVPWSSASEALVRRIVADFGAPDAPPAITGVNSVFHVAGAVQGEGETQIFLDTANGAPISLSIIRRPDEQPALGVSLGELVDNSAALPAPDSPLWYRLACSLPAALPADALRGQAAPDAAAASRDYAVLLKAMPVCERAATPIG